MMAKQWIAEDFGGPSVLALREVALPDPAPGEVLIAVRACGMNPADYKHFGPGQDRALLPLTVGYEVAGVIAAIGPGTLIATGPGHIGDAVIGFQVAAGYATAVLVPAEDVFAKPDHLSFAQAANLLLVGTTAAELIAAAAVSPGDTVLVHGAAGAVGVSLVQQLKLAGAQVIGTAGERDFDLVRQFGGVPVAYGPGLEERVEQAAPQGISVALDTVGTDEAVDVSWALLEDPRQLVSIAAFARSGDGVRLLGSQNPHSAPFRAAVRGRIVDLAASGDLTVPMAATFPFEQAPAAVEMLAGPHPSGKLALTVG
jgi:NADPH:quinone reductase-like Zn-dependent oxidoreductase